MAEACILFPGCTPDTCLKMPALLFFRMLAKGRSIRFRQRNREYYQLCMVAAYPSYTPDSQQELVQSFYDASLSPEEWVTREQVRKQAQQTAAEHYRPSTAALDFFKSRGMNGGR